MHSFKFEISLRITTSNIDPVDISTRLKLIPEFQHKKGEQRKTPKGELLKGVYENSYCCFAYNRVDDEELHSMLDRIVTGLMSHSDLFDKISVNGGHAEFFIGWYSPGNTGDLLNHELLNKLSQLKIDLALDVYGGD